MAQAHRRKKAPDQVRHKLLMATKSLALESGAASITMDAVARRAGVSKGGLQHHFPHRKALLDALFNDSWERFQERVALAVAQDPEPKGRGARAYLRAIDAATDEDDKHLGRLLTVLILEDAEFRKRWVEKILGALPVDEPEDTDAHARLFICRFATDGLWLNDLIAGHELSPELRSSFIRQLCELTKR